MKAEQEHVPVREPDRESSAFARWGRMVSDRPWPWAIASMLVLVVLAIPLFWLRLGQLDAGTDPTSQSSRRAYDLLTQGFGPGVNGPITVVVELPTGSDPNTVLGGISSTLQKTEGVASVGAPSVSPSGRTGVLNVIPTTAPDAEQTTDLVDRLRDDVLPTVGEQTYLAGTVAGYVDFTEKIAGRMIWLILAVVLLSLVLLTVAFRSIVIAVKAAVLNLLSVGAAYGVVIAVFQFGWGSGLLGLDEKVPIPAFVPMLMFAIVFGLSMDYEVFLLSRVHEVWVAHRRRAPQRRDRDRQHGQGHHHRGRDHGRRVQQLRAGQRPDDQDARGRDGGRRAHRRQPGPDDPGAGAHVDPGPAGLVAAGLAGPDHPGPQAGGRRGV